MIRSVRRCQKVWGNQAVRGRKSFHSGLPAGLHSIHAGARVGHIYSSRTENLPRFLALPSFMATGAKQAVRRRNALPDRWRTPAGRQGAAVHLLISTD